MKTGPISSPSASSSPLKFTTRRAPGVATYGLAAGGGARWELRVHWKAFATTRYAATPVAAPSRNQGHHPCITDFPTEGARWDGLIEPISRGSGGRLKRRAGRRAAPRDRSRRSRRAPRSQAGDRGAQPRRAAASGTSGSTSGSDSGVGSLKTLPPTLRTAVPYWRAGDTIALRANRMMRVVVIRDDDAEQALVPRRGGPVPAGD